MKGAVIGMSKIQCEHIIKVLNEHGIKYERSASMANYSTFRSGGHAALLVLPQSLSQLTVVLEACSALPSENILVIGKGSNLLFCEDEWNGVVICTVGINSVTCEGNFVFADCGASISKICACAERNALSGLEFAYGIPGSCGGAVFMNAGAYGGQISDVLSFSEYYDIKSHKTVRLTGIENDFSYRHSFYADNPDCVVIRAGFELCDGNSEEIHMKMSEYMARRKEKQPLDMPSAGSVFKRPPNAFAGALIEQCGLKGTRIGDAEVSTKHAGFIVNCGNASFGDICSLIERVKAEVLEKTGVALECEVRLIRNGSV